MFVKLNSQMVIEDIDSIFLEKLGISKKEIYFKTIDEILDIGVPHQAVDDFYKAAYKKWKHSSIFKFRGRNQAFWLGYKFDVCIKHGRFCGLAIDLYEVPKEVQVISQSVFNELLAEECRKVL